MSGGFGNYEPSRSKPPMPPRASAAGHCRYDRCMAKVAGIGAGAIGPAAACTRRLAAPVREA